MPMKFQVRIQPDGKILTEVVDRGQHLCSDVYKVTNAVGQALSEDEIGPECDIAREVVTQMVDDAKASAAQVKRATLVDVIEETLGRIESNNEAIVRLRSENSLLRSELRAGEKLLARSRKPAKRGT